MATLKLDLSNLSYHNTNNVFCIINADKTNLKYAGYKVEAVSTDGKTVTFADGSTLNIATGGNVTFKSESGTGTFEVGVLDPAGYTAATKAVEDQVKAVTDAAAAADGADKDSVAAALNKEAANYDKNTLNYVLFDAAATAASEKMVISLLLKMLLIVLLQLMLLILKLLILPKSLHWISPMLVLLPVMPAS